MNRKYVKMIFIIVFLASFAVFLYKQYQNINAKIIYEHAVQLINERTDERRSAETVAAEAETEEATEGNGKALVWQETSIDDDPFAVELAKKNLSALREVNPDVIGWIEIPGTQLAYPIMDGDDNEYYLEHTWDKQSNTFGSVFLECFNNSDLRDFNTLIYGHRMMNGSMFGSLKYFRNKEYFQKHPYVYILDASGVHRYEIFSAYTAPVNSMAFEYGFLNEEMIRLFLEYCVSKSEIDTGVVPTLNDKILTLVTCTGKGYEARWVVQACLRGAEENTKSILSGTIVR